MNVLEGKTALVTGGSRGIGRAVALKLASMGAEVLIAYHESGEVAEETAHALSLAGGRTAVFKIDVARAGSFAPVIDAIKARGGLDILVNNAGITRDKTLKKMSDAEWDEVIQVNLTGVFNATKAVLPLMRPGGRIVNVSSIVGICGGFGQSNYAASKAGVIGFTKALAKECVRDGITVNAVAPGFVETRMTDAMPEEVRRRVLEMIPMKRMGTPAEIAETVAFLASPAASYITGSVVRVDGGLSF